MKPPEYLGPYRIGESLGKGGMGSVFEGRHAKSDEHVAVKLISPQVSDDKSFRRRFDMEVKTLQKLKHPNIVRLIGFGEEQGQLFYSMEFARGDSLQERIRKEKKLPWATALEIAIQTCSALKHAHDLGIIHRDLKPANLMVAPDNTVKLVDFGISKIFGYDQTAAGSIMGTADYMAPEQASQSGATARTDLYSLGCVLYTMLVGRPPFRGKNITEVIAAVQYQQPVPLDMIDPELPDDVVQIVNELLSKDPKDRPPTALATMNRLKAMKAGLSRMQTLYEKKSAGPDDEATMKHETSLKNDEKTVISDQTVVEGSTEFHTVNPAAGTLETRRSDSKEKTISRTRVTGDEIDSTAPPSQAKDVTGYETSDTFNSDTGKTHFQTVSEGEYREGFFTPPEPPPANPTKKVLSIIVLLAAVVFGLVLVVNAFRKPSASDRLTQIDAIEDSTSKDAIDRREQFVKLFPEHPRAEQFRDDLMANKVDAAIKRLKLKAKLRSSEDPLYEQAFLDAVSSRESDPSAAREKLLQWIEVFADVEPKGQDDPRELAKLASFEADRLKDATAKVDPRLTELMERVDAAINQPRDERDKLFNGIETLYEDTPWAKPALDRIESLRNGE
ncbi:MAG: serine/threonine-protein kinase [Planctomycetota bacterium]